MWYVCAAPTLHSAEINNKMLIIIFIFAHLFFDRFGVFCGQVLGQFLSEHNTTF